MSKVTPITVIAITYSSERDTNGNTYHWARFMNPQRGRHVSVACEVGGSSNADGIACTLADGWEGTLSLHIIQPKREWRHCRPDSLRYEGDPTVARDLRALMPRSHHAAIDREFARRRRIFGTQP